MLALPIDGDIPSGIDSVFAQKIAKRVFRRGALSGGDDGLSAQIIDGLQGISVFHDVQNAQRIDRQHLNFAAGFVVQNGGEVGGNARHVRFALQQRGRDRVGGSGDGKGVGVVVFMIPHHFGESHCGRPLQRRDRILRLRARREYKQYRKRKAQGE